MKKTLFVLFAFCCGAFVAFGDIEVTNAVFDGLSYGSASATVTLDQRTSFGGRLARGVVRVGTAAGDKVTVLDTSQEENGWRRVTDGELETQLAYQNSENITVEGGRITDYVVWDSNTVHLVQHWVTVASGATLLLGPGTIVKFTEDSGIWVEDGGVLDLRTSAILTQDMDDSIGGNTDLRALVNKRQNAQIHIMPNGTLQDTGLCENRYVYVNTYGTISVNVAQVLEQEGRVFAEFSFTGSHPTSFNCDYTTEDGTATVPNDYQTRSGWVGWSGDDTGSKWVEIPITEDTIAEEDEYFSLKITAVRGMNMAVDEAKIKIVDSKLRINGSDATEVAAVSARFDQRTGIGGHLAHGVEKVGTASGASASDWDTTAAPDGWVRKSDGDETSDLLVRNGASVEEGRLTADSVWSNDTVHLVRNWVTVPNGKTLTILPGATVKFTEDTGIRVEDGGKLIANGEATNRVVFTVMTDDAAGADDDCRAEAASRNGAQIYAQSSGSVVENGYLETRYLNLSTFGSVSVEDAKILEQTRCAYVPITLNTGRGSAFEVDWVAVDGTATLSNDYQRASGTLHWDGSGEGTKFIEIPVVEDAVDEGTENFTVKLVAARGVNLNRENASVEIVDSLLKVNGDDVCATNASPVRFEQRASFGGHLAHGVENVGSVSGEVVRVWNTVEEEDGWHTLADGTNTFEVATLNDAGLAIEGGRLTGDMTWSNDLVHVVRNWVTVPNGVTLTVTPGTIVKFTDETGLWVEDGGRVNVVGTEAENVVFTHADDDSVGGNLDGIDSVADWKNVSIYKMPNATFAENGWLETRCMNIGSYGGSVSVQDARAIEVIGATYVPITVSGSRSSLFSIDWKAVDGTAKFGDDYTLASGTVSWSGSGEGTKFITIPLVQDSVYETNETFKVKIVAVRGVNIARGEATIDLVDSELMVDGKNFASAAGSARLEMRTGFGGRLAHGEEQVGSISGEVVRVWNTVNEADGYHTLTDGTNEMSVATVNDAAITVEEGRLTASTTWTPDTLHLVRNWVTVPSGVTLTVAAGTKAKFTENTGICVEDGGKLNVVGAQDGRVTFTTFDDDTLVGDTDFATGVAAWHGVQIYKMPSGTVSDNGWFETRKVNVSNWAGVYVQNAQAAELNGIAYVPVTLSGSRNAAFHVDWEVVPGTAALNDDYTLASGTLDWSGTGEGTKFIQVPLVVDNVPEDIENFMVRLRGACGMNVYGESSNVTIIDARAFLPCAPMSQPANAVRFDQRTSLGGRLVHGVEKVGTTSGESVRLWNTSAENDGWKHLEDEMNATDVLVRNVAPFVIEEGRLAGNATWNSDTVHLVRNWVTVPSGVTLMVAEGTVVKFTEDTGIKVEDGGKLNVAGTLDNRVVFTMTEDDTTGGDADLRTVAAKKQGVQIYKMSGGTFSENGFLELRNMTASNWGSVSVQNAQTHEGKGVVYVPVTLSGSRNAAFSVYWRVVDGSATYGDDFTLVSGRLAWSGTGEGTKYVQVPIVSDDVVEGHEHFTLELTGGCGMNLGTAVADVEIFDSGEFEKVYVSGDGRLEQRTNLVARLVRGTVHLPFGDWSADSSAATVRITATPTMVEGANETLFVATTPTNGTFAWNSAALPDGWWHLTHEELDTNGVVLATEEADLDVQQNVVVHEGVMTTNEYWQGHGLTHYLANDWWVPETLRLDVGAGAVVKSESDGRIVVETNAVLAVVGTETEPVVFTSARDDAHGGDMDGGLYDEPQIGDWYGFKLFSAESWTMDWASILYATPGEFSTVDMTNLDHLEVDKAWFGTSFKNNDTTTKTVALRQEDGAATYTGTISGNLNLAKTGAGTLRFQDRQSYSGETTVAGGTLRLAAADPQRTLSPIVWRHKKYGYDRNGTVDANWKTLPMADYQMAAVTNSMKLLWVSSSTDTGESASWKDLYFSMAQNRLDGWFYASEEESGTWQFAKYHDDYLGLKIDDAWVLVNAVWTDRPVVNWSATQGWHRFTIVFGDAVGGYGALDGKCSLMVSVNGADAVPFDEDYFKFAGDEEDGTVLPDYGSYDSATVIGSEGTVYPVNATTQLWNNAFLVHRWSFNSNFVDSVGGQDATACGTAKPDFTADGKAVHLPGGVWGTSWVDLGVNVLSNGEPATIEIWATQNQAKQWSRVFDFGSGQDSCLFFAWTVETRTDRECFGVHNTINDIQGALGGFACGTPYYIAVTFQPTEDNLVRVNYSKWDAVSGVCLAKNTFLTSEGWRLASQNHQICALGHSFYPADNDASADYDEVRIWNAALSEAQMTANAKAGPDVLPDIRTNLVSGQSYVVSNGAKLDLNGQMLTCGNLTGSGTVTNGSVLASGTVSGDLSLEGIALRGETEIAGDTPATPDAKFWQDHPDILEAAGGDAEAAKLVQSPGKSGKGKFKPNGEPMKVWEDYVAGTDPEDEEDQFTAKVEMVDGKPVITWEPALNDTATEKGVKKGKRVYRTLGKKTLGDEMWAEIKTDEESNYNFFKVTVEMP